MRRVPGGADRGVGPSQLQGSQRPRGPAPTDEVARVIGATETTLREGPKGRSTNSVVARSRRVMTSQTNARCFPWPVNRVRNAVVRQRGPNGAWSEARFTVRRSRRPGDRRSSRDAQRFSRLVTTCDSEYEQPSARNEGSRQISLWRLVAVRRRRSRSCTQRLLQLVGKVAEPRGRGPTPRSWMRTDSRLNSVSRRRQDDPPD